MDRGDQALLAEFFHGPAHCPVGDGVMSGQVPLSAQPSTWRQLTRGDPGRYVVSHPDVGEVLLTSARRGYVAHPGDSSYL